ncbi:hypothetical protein V5799_011262 [Amblyomma americanum]|uniref:Secreted protein n=1 Tax=Amblyomma americanum TaxID=6943 RepID=A0AAQ4EID9_AMBAM
MELHGQMHRTNKLLTALLWVCVGAQSASIGSDRDDALFLACRCSSLTPALYDCIAAVQCSAVRGADHCQGLSAEQHARRSRGEEVCIMQRSFPAARLLLLASGARIEMLMAGCLAPGDSVKCRRLWD